MTAVLDPEGAHLAALRRLGDFRGQRVLELGCGDGRLTVGIAARRGERARVRPGRRGGRAGAALAAGRACRARRLPRRLRQGDRARAALVRPRRLLLVALMRRPGGRRARPGQHGRSGQARRARPRPAGDPAQPDRRGRRAASSARSTASRSSAPPTPRPPPSTRSSSRTAGRAGNRRPRRAQALRQRAELVDDFADKQRRLPDDAASRLRALSSPASCASAAASVGFGCDENEMGGPEGPHPPPSRSRSRLQPNVPESADRRVLQKRPH